MCWALFLLGGAHLRYNGGMTKQEAIEKYTALGLEIEEGFDVAGTVYPPHKHEQTYLFSGAITLKTERTDWQTYIAGMECVVGGGELHEARVGEEGWEYVAAWDAKEAELYPETH